jgi:2,3-dihydroxybenzoate decarboxylase
MRTLLICPDTPYENVKEGQDWWKTVDIPADQKELVGRTNAIRLYKLPLEE